MRSSGFVWIGLVVLGTVACGSDSTSAGGIALAELPPKVASALCTAYEHCYGPVFSLFLNGSDCAAVTEQRVRNGSFPRWQSSIDQGKLRYDGAQVQACLDSLAARSCAQLLDRDTPQCLSALDGTVELGGACDLDEECKGSALCQASTATCPGQCVALLVAGQACRKDSDCQSGLQCSTETGACVAPAAANERCEYNAPPCGPGLLCLGKDDTARTSGTCLPPTHVFAAAENAACDPTTQQLCQLGLSCVADSYTTAVVWRCVKTGSYAGGGACKPGFPDACATGSYCLAGSSGLEALSGTCTAIPGAGAPCTSAFAAQCQPNAVCVSGTCQNLAANGVSCTGDAMCYSESCTEGVCQAELPCN
jgi:hypothetical protein